MGVGLPRSPDAGEGRADVHGRRPVGLRRVLDRGDAHSRAHPRQRVLPDRRVGVRGGSGVPRIDRALRPAQLQPGRHGTVAPAVPHVAGPAALVPGARAGHDGRRRAPREPVPGGARVVELAPPRGTEDLLPPASTRMAELYRRSHRLARRFGYRYVETPGFEHTELFARTSGETSDVVGKEMYTFLDRADRSLTLRPEGTAPVVRAYLRPQNEQGVPFKAYYVNQAWRYNKPQKGRLREFRIFGAEVLGVEDPGADVEIVALAAAFLREIGVAEVDLQVNSIGDEVCRPAYRQALLDYLEAQAPRLRDEH